MNSKSKLKREKSKWQTGEGSRHAGMNCGRELRYEEGIYSNVPRQQSEAERIESRFREEDPPNMYDLME